MDIEAGRVVGLLLLVVILILAVWVGRVLLSTLELPAQVKQVVLVGLSVVVLVIFLVVLLRFFNIHATL